MAEDAQEFLRERREIDTIKEEIGEIEERLGLLDDKVSGVQRALVEFRALIITRGISSDSWTKIFWKWLDEGSCDEDMAREHNAILNELRLALASLRGKLAEEAIPEDAYKAWRRDARKRLSEIVGAKEADSLIGGSNDWGKIIGLPDIEVEE
jgi:hypothetical protein